MNFKVNFSEQGEGFSTKFGEVQNVGTTDHDLLTNRCIPDQHCIGSITGLEDALAEKLPASSFVFGTINGTVYEGSAGAKNSEDIAFVKQVLIEAGTITKIEVEQAYTSRVTANGENIVDGQKTPVTMIKGSTVRDESTNTLKHARISGIVSTGRNLLDISKLVGDSLVDNGDGTYTMTKNGNKRWSRVWTLDTPILLEHIFSNLELVEKTTTADKLAIIATLTNGVQRFFGLAVDGSGRYAISGEVKSFRIYLNATEPDGAYFKFKNPYITRQVEGNNYYTPFIQETYQLPETLELPEWDSFNPQTGEIIRATSEQVVLTGTDGERWYFEKTEKHYRVALENAYSFDMTLPNKMVSNLFSNVNSYPDYKTPYIGGSALAPRMWVYLPLDWGITTLDEWKAFLQAQAEAGNPLIVEYELATPTVEKIENAPKSYTAYNQGNETSVLENEEFGAIPTITNEYFKVKV